MSDNKTSSRRPPATDENQIVAERRAKLAELREDGQRVPERLPARRTWPRELHAAVRRQDQRRARSRAARPRRGRRPHAAEARHGQGAASPPSRTCRGRIQLYVTQRRDRGRGVYDAFKHWDLGDILGAEGTLFRTTHRRALGASRRTLRLLSKSLRPLPEKFHGLTDQEQRYRQRYVDLDHQSRSRSACSRSARASCRRSASSSSRAATSRSRRR